MASVGRGIGSAFRVLRTLASLVTAVLLALDLARVAGDETRLLQNRTKLGMRQHEGTRNAVPDRRRLRRDAPAADVYRKVVLTAGVGELEGLVHDHARRLTT